MQNRLPVFLALVWVWGLQSICFSQVQYNFYFGDIHSQSWYSDGNQEQNPSTYTVPVARAITYARDVANDMDFLGVSDHNHNESLNMTLPYWRAGNREADSVNQDGVFVGMRGQEWGTISGGGHVLVYGTDKLFGWNPGVYDVYVPKSNYALLIDSVKKYGGFAYLAHPQSSDYSNLISTVYKASWDSVIQGVAMKNGPALTAGYSESNPASGNYESYFHSMLKLGYHVAPVANQDNHFTNFGMLNQQRTVVLATSLTQANVLDALRNRRAYATEDHNLQLRFEVGTHQMGEVFSTSGSIPFRIKVTDGNGEAISRIDLRSGVPGSGSVPTTLTSVTNTDSLILAYSQALNTTYYYYAYVLEADGQAAWSAPMWITIVAGNVPPSAFNLSSPASGSTNQLTSGMLTWQSAPGASSYDVYLGTTNPPTTLVSTGQAGTTYAYSALTASQTYYWQVIAQNAYGSTTATGSPFSFTTLSPPAAFTLQSPANGSFNQSLSGTLTWQASSGATQYDVYLDGNNSPTTIVSSNQAGTTYGYSGLSNNATYYWKVVAKNSVGSIVATIAPWNFTTLPPVPGSFTLLSPVSSSTNQTISGTLTWQSSSNATAYDVYLDGNNSPTTIVSSNQTGTTYGYSGLSNNTTYYWKVVAKNSAGSIVATGSPWNFSTLPPAPGSFTLLSPASGSTNQTISGTLTWQSSPNATGYDVYLDGNNPPTTIVSSNQPGNIFEYSGLLHDVIYYWKIIAKNAADSIVAVNASFNFTTIVDMPGAFALSSPLNNSTALPTSDTLHWDISAYATAYDVYLDTQNPPLQIVSQNQTASLYVYGGLSQGTVYYWKVVAKNIVGGIQSTGVPWNFSTHSVQLPSAFNLTAPQNNAFDQPSNITLQWESSVDATRYDVYLDTLSNPATLVSVDQIGTNVSVNGLSYNAIYYWKVVAKNNVGIIVSSGSPWQFATVAMPKGFTLLSPNNQMINQPLFGTLRWRSSQNATLYDVYIDQNNPPQVKIVGDLNDTSFSYNGLLPNTTYYWSVTAKNANGSATSLNAPSVFSTGNYPVTPSSVQAVVTAHSIQLSWSDDATNEEGYRVYRSSGPNMSFVQYGPDLGMNATTFTDTGLFTNKRYVYKIIPFNSIGEGSYANKDVVTLAIVPGIPLVSVNSYSSARIVIDPLDNAPSTSFALRIEEGAVTYYVQQNGAIGDIPYWQSFSEWGGLLGVTISGLRACHSYAFSALASNEDGVETAASTSVNENLPCQTASVAVHDGWELLSVPVKAQDMGLGALFPTSVSNAFCYEGTYLSKMLLEYGKGYWIKFDEAGELAISGESIDSGMVSLATGWNLLGISSQPVSVSSIIEDPPGILTSDFFGFDGNYSIADTLFPMHGYWVRASSQGKMLFPETISLAKQKSVIRGGPQDENTLLKLTFRDSAHHYQTLFVMASQLNEDEMERFELPPLPPSGSFDVRFSTGHYVENLSTRTERTQEFAITIQGGSAPLIMSWEQHNIFDHKFVLCDSSKSIDLRDKGEIQVRAGIEPFRLQVESGDNPNLPQEFALYQNYPNPFNSSTEIFYDVPVTCDVEIAIYNLLGTRVATVDHQRREAGRYSLVWMANLASGVYFYTMKAQSTLLSSVHFQQSKKMMLMR